MKEIADRTGRFARRPYYECQELDRECEDIICGYLKKKHGESKFPVSTDDLTTLLEQHVQDLELYADLSEFGTNVEGVTIFNSKGKPAVRITKALTDDAHRENRLRTTLTHEFGHVRFHAYLFSLDDSGSFNFGDTINSGRNQPKAQQVCKRETIVDAPVSDWMEWQAGHVCGAILMPATRVRKLLYDGFHNTAGDSTISVESRVAKDMIVAVQRAFSVSQDAARVRLLRLEAIKPSTSANGLF